VQGLTAGEELRVRHRGAVVGAAAVVLAAPLHLEVADAGLRVVAAATDEPRVVEPAVQGSYTTLQVVIRRENYYAGPVSVTVSAQSGSATSGDDFQLTPVKLTWGNGEAATQTVSVSVLSDKVREGDETFSIVMSEPTGGALLGKSSVTATITDTKPAGSGSGGGGSTGVLTLLALGFARLIRTRRA
jgi:hypothetical protein